MADPFVAEVRIFGFNFAPKGWAFCDGQLLPLSQNTALFALLGTVYGGNGKSNFALPDLQGSVPMHPGQGQGLSMRDLGESSGAESVTLLQSEMPVHGHTKTAGVYTCFYGTADRMGPAGAVPAQESASMTAVYVDDANPQGQMSGASVAPAGGGLPHNNMMPYMTLNFCIALQGVFPPRP